MFDMTAQFVPSDDPVVLNGDTADAADKLFKKASDKSAREGEIFCDDIKSRQ